VVGVEVPGDVDVVRVAGTAGRDDRDVVEPVRPAAGLADPDLDLSHVFLRIRVGSPQA
jgi:hypothetical protein